MKAFNWWSSPWNSPRQLAIAEVFAEANSTFIVITSVKILARWLFPSKIYIQFKIFNTYFMTKLLSTNRRYHLRNVCTCYKKSDLLYVLGSLFIPFLFVHVAMEQTLLSHYISLYIFKQLLFCFIVLPFVHLLAPKKNKTCDTKQKLFVLICKNFLNELNCSNLAAWRNTILLLAKLITRSFAK